MKLISYTKSQMLPTPITYNEILHYIYLQVSSAYLQFLLGPSTNMLFDFVKEMPKPETQLRLDFSSLLGPLFFTWVILQLFPVCELKFMNALIELKNLE